MSTRALSFGSTAEAYERFRPGYPQRLVDVIRAYAAHPIRSALEIGAGTGKATRLLVANGVAVTATDPDPAMLAELRTQVPAAEIIQAAFEDIAISRRYDLVLAAAALHWTQPDGRWDRVAAWVEPGGVFTNVGGPVRLADPMLAARVQAAHSPYLETGEVPPPDGAAADSPMLWPGTEVAACGLFEDVTQLVIKRRIRLSRAGFVGYLGTVSAYLQLPEHTRRQALSAIARVLPGEVKVCADVIVHLGRRAGGDRTPRP
ncbi:MAG: class I SAM-dependent methyltransferase [Tetrasphaera sp.]